ncbi:glycosyltransferase family 9 protein [candidate division KSB1 bacterium]
MEYLLYFTSLIISKLINSNKNKSNIGSILIVKLDHLGDVITSLPSVYAIRRKFPEAEITSLVGEWVKDVLKNNPYIDNVIIYNSKRFEPKKHKYSLSKTVKLLSNIFEKRYDLIVGLRDDWLTLVFSLIYFPKVRIDRGTVRFRLKYKKFSDLFLRRTSSDKNIHEIDTNMMIAETGGIDQIKEEKSIFLTDKERNWAEDFLASLGLKGKRFVIISPGAKWKYRRWDVRKFANLADKIKKEFELEIVIAGSKDEIDTAEEMQKIMKGDSISIAGKTNIRQILSLLERALLCITNDSGMVHLSSGLNVPIAAIFGPQDPEKFGPWSDNSIVFHKKVDCFPCSQKKCIQKNSPCVNLIDVNDVFKKIRIYFL